MNAKRLLDLLEKRITSKEAFRRPTWIWGPPGIGKSDIVKLLATKHGYWLHDVRAVTLDSVDVRGIPTVINGRMSWAVPDFFPTGEHPSILFLDELAQASMSVMNAFLQLTLDRRLGNYVLPDNCFIVAASNRQQDRAGANRVSTALSFRFKHLDLECDLNDWCDWAVNRGIDSRITSCMRWRPNLLHDFDPTKSDKASPNPRSWEMLHEELQIGVDRDSEMEVYGGIVGPGAASEFLTFCDVWAKLPDPRAVLKDPDGAVVFTSSEPDKCWAMIGSLIEVCRQDRKLLPEFGRYVIRNTPEFAVYGLKTAATFDPSILSQRPVANWIAANKGLII